MRALFDDPTRILDAHVHYYDVSVPEGQGQSPERHWLDPSFVHWTLGDLNAFRGARFMPAELRAQGHQSNVGGAIHVQASRHYADPVEETRWLTEYADTPDMPLLAIIANAPMAAADCEAVLDRHAEFPLVRGIRDFAANTHLDDPSFRRGLALLAARDWCFEWDAQWQLAEEIVALAAAVPDLRLILEHSAFPPDPGPERDAWRAALGQLAECENIAIKLSGWSVTPRLWTAADGLEMMGACLDAFGTERVFFGSNWPFGMLTSSFRDVVDAFELGLADLSSDERHRLRSQAALHWYGIR